MADGGVWKLQDDGYLNIDAEPDSVIYHPDLNILIVLSRNAESIVVDINSGSVLRKCVFSDASQPVKGTYLPSYDKVLLTNNKAVGVRSDYNGVLLLDTMLQTCLKNKTSNGSKNNNIKLEILVSEAILLQQTLKTIETSDCEFSPGLWTEVLSQLEAKIEAAQSEPKKSAKSQKWNIICLELRPGSFKTCYSLVSELKRQNRHVPALAIASAINERLNRLHAVPTPPDVAAPQADTRNLMFSEAARRETFAKWPHMDYKWALPDQMAQAGFYHQPNATGDDRAMCFTCTVCLVCWEPTDEPWAEHERHSPCCPFVKGEYTQNVPLSVTYATAPALPLKHRLAPALNLVDTSTLPGYIPLVSCDGHATVLNFVRQLKVETEFSVSKLCTDYGLPHSDLSVSAAAIASQVKHSVKCSESTDDAEQNSESQGQPVPRPCLLLGTRITTRPELVTHLIQRLESGVLTSSSAESAGDGEQDESPQLLLLVLDFHYPGGASGPTGGPAGTNKKAVSGTGTSTASMPGAGCKLTQWENKAMAMYHQPLIDEIMDDDFLVTVSSSPQPSTSNSSSDVTHSQLKKELWSLLETSNLCSTSLKKLRLALENKLNCDLSQRVLEFGDIVTSYFQDLSKKETGGTAVSSDLFNMMFKNKDSYDQPFYGFMDDDLDPSFDSMDGVGFSFVPPASTASIKALESEAFALEAEVNAVSASLIQSQAAPALIQIIRVPCQSTDTHVIEIHPLLDHLHVLVILSDGTLHLYSLDHTEKVVKLSDFPVQSLQPQVSGDGLRKAILLPQDQSINVVAGLTGRGSLVLLDALTLRLLSRLDPPEGTDFITLTFCNSLERICVATSKGSLRFYALRDEDEFRLREETSSSPVMTKKKMNTAQYSSSSTNSSGATINELLTHRASYGLPELRSLYSLTLFEPLTPGYSAAVPPCWSELMQAQKQRRHAQHLTREDIHTRSWRLQNDLTTWDEHMFELSLPKNTCVGQVDVKLALHTPCPQVPPLQVTLLRPITSRAPFQSSATGTNTTGEPSGAATGEDFGAKSNPVTSDVYSNFEILCGPVNISNCLDLSDQSCTIAFSSPRLLNTKNRQLFVHIKALNFVNTPHKSKSKDKDSSSSGKPTPTSSSGGLTCINMIKPSAGASSSGVTGEFRNFLFGNGGSSMAKKSESFIGCDWIHEISITIRKSKSTDIPNERLERSVMLESPSVVEKLLQAVTATPSTVPAQCIALDILIWIAVIRLGRLRSTQDSAESQDSQLTFVKQVESQLGDLCHSCFIRGGRTLARKCAKLLVICSDGAKNATDASKVAFDASLLRVLVDLLPHICMAWSAGSVRWFFQMLNKVMVLDTSALAPQRCLDILNAVGAQLQARQNPYHLILRTRFGLHGCPLEPELFDMEPLLPSRVSGGAVPVSYSHGGLGEGAWVSSNNSWFHVSSTPFTTCPAGLSSEPLDWRELLMPTTSGEAKATPAAAKMKGVSLSHYMKGLLEAEPLHFSCSAMSDGTKLEKIDPTPATPVFPMYPGPSACAAAARTTPAPDSCIIVDAASPEDAADVLAHGGSSTPTRILNPWIDGEGNFTEPKMTSGDFFKSFTSSDISGGGAGGQDFMDASTSTPLDTSASTGPVSGRVASAAVSGAGQEEAHWSSLLVPPPQQVMVIERMHSGARRFIVLDFGRPVLLTDLLIPACSELLSLSIDIWVRGEEADALRLVVTPDIALKNLILSDIQPPPICRYLKITTIGRYGMSTAKCKVPVGSYYGHTLILPGEDYAEKSANSASCETNIKAQLQLLSSLHEDIYCRYSLCCTKLKQHMSQLLLSETPNVVHMHRYFNRKKENNIFLPEPKDKIISCYKECVTYQHQLNIVKSVIRRLSPPAVSKDPLVLAGSSDKLRLIGECLLDSVLYYVYEIGPVPKAPPSLSLKLDEDLCSRLFSAFCITEETRLQVATAALLVATCGSQPWWGDFLTQRFCHLYASQQALIFPQDRTLMLFSWLGRKSLSLCASLVDSLLLALLTHLEPLAHATPSPGFLRARTDQSLVTWLLMFLSQVLDCSCGDANKSFGTRWDFMCGELAMQKQKLKPKASNSTCRGNRRRLQKKLMNQSTSCISDLMKPTHHSKYSVEKVKTSSSGSGVVPGSSGKSAECFVTPLISLPRHHCLPSARAILAFILHLDYTCNVDTFLIACKDLSRIVISTSPTLSLPELLSESELLHLLRLAVWSDQHRAVWGGPWTLHALTCLLLDLLEAASATGIAPPTAAASPPAGEEESATAPCSPTSQSTSPPSLSPYVLPSVLESDDSDLEDFLDDILERGRILVHKVPAFVPKSSMGGISCSMSLAMDSRLEYGVENNAEVTLKRLTAQSAYNLPISINSSLPSVGDSVPASEWTESLTSPWQREETQLSGLAMLSNSFNTLFSELDTLTGWSNIEQILELWLTLNGSGKSSGEDSTGRKFNASYVPVIPLAETSISTLIKALTLRPNVSLRTWCLSFETLTLATNMPVTATGGPSTAGGTADPLIGMARVIISEPTFVRMMFTFMSSTQLKTNQLAGPSVCSAFRQFMVRLQARCDILSFSSSSPGEISTGIQLKQHLLSLLYLLVQHKGPLSCQAGPLDVQCEFIMHLLHLHFSAHHLPTAMSILESIGMLLYSYVTSLDTLKCLSVNEASVNNPLSCFHNAWSSLMSSSSPPSSSSASSEAKLLKLPSHQTLILNLLRFATKLVQIPLDENYAGGDGNSQTDEHKAEQNLYASSTLPCLADVVLRHNTSMEHLLTSLACASSSSFAMILSSSSNLSFTDSLEPSCVGDGVFQLLVTLTSKASSRSLALTPILQFLSNWNKSSHGVFQFSEPFVWLLMKRLGSPESVAELVELGGVGVICQGLVQSHALLINPHPSQVSVLMQHLSQFPAYNLVGAGGASTSKKANAPPVPDSWTYPPKLINFAPLGTITTPNAASQTPDVLIQSTPPHRRARSPAWSYHFFADESCVELTITLPCAILLKEIQLQPHVSSLCTCPSAVGLEVCHGLGTGMVPVGPPLETAGLTFIRLNLPSPEVVTGVLLRLYRAKDSSSLGLTQIRVIGATSFGDTAFQMCNAAIPDEAKLTKSSIGWLRVLSHVIGTPRPDSPLLRSLLDATAASSPRLLDALASLLLLPAPPPSLYAPGLKHVLLSLGLHSRPLGLALLEILLHNGAVTFMQGTLPLGKNTTASLESVVELIFMLCTTQDAHTLDRLTLLLSWLRNTAEECLKEESHLPPASMYIHCTSVVLWSLQEQALLSSELRTLVSDELFLSVYAWTLQVKEESALKTALDNVLCSMCYIRPCLFSTLLHKMGILIPEPLTSAPVSDDRKDYSDLTDDSKEQVQSVLCDLRKLKVSEPQLMTVAAASQSPAATRTLLGCGLAARLAAAVLEFCTSHQTDADKASHQNGLALHASHVATVLRFFTALCSTAVMKDWLGSPEGSVFWFPLLSYLDQKTSESAGFGYSWELSSVIPQLEALTTSLLAQATRVHPPNQRLLARVLSQLLASRMSGFTRRLVLQLLLENEKVLLCIDRPAVNAGDFTSALPHPHPSFGIGHTQHLLCLPTDTSISDILLCNLASSSSSDLPGMLKHSLKPPSSSCKLERDPQLSEIQETLSATLTAGNTAKDKRIKDACKQVKPLKKRSLGGGDGSGLPLPPYLACSVRHERIPEELPHALTLSQLLQLHPPPTPHLKLSISSPTMSNNNNTASSSNSNDEKVSSLLSTPHLQTPLQVFSQLGGLALLAKHLPAVNPGAFQFPALDRCEPGGKYMYYCGEDQSDADWVKIDFEIYEDMEDINDMTEPESSGGTCKNKKLSEPAGAGAPGMGGTVPPHSLAAFGLFLRLPGYADVLLRDKKKAMFLLRLVLGVSDDGEGGDIFKSSVARSLPTLPFHTLEVLLQGTPPSTDDGALLRQTALDLGVLHLLLTCLAYLTHLPTDLAPPVQPGFQQANSGSSSNNNQKPNTSNASNGTVYNKSDDKSHLYWAKGTGFGTGSTTQNWNIEHALSRQRLEEEHVTALLRVLSAFIGSPPESAESPNPVSSEQTPSDVQSSSARATTNSNPDPSVVSSSTKPHESPPPPLPPLLKQLIRQSCLLPALSSYLRNDSVLDMARHIPLYRGVLELIRALARDPELGPLLLPPSPDTPGPASSSDSASIHLLLCNIKSCVDIYLSRLKSNDNGSKSKSKTNTTTSVTDPKNRKVSWQDQDEDLITLVDDIRGTVAIVQSLATEPHADASNALPDVLQPSSAPVKTLEERYLEVMRALQFGMYDMVVAKDEEGTGFKFTVAYHFESNVRSSGERCHPSRNKRLAQETVTLSTALPLSYSSSVFVRCDNDRLDIMKVLITGPSDTPYANGCFEFDVYFPPEYPGAPMLINLCTTGRHSVRFNPNLYNDGKVCLSILNTWHGRPEEKWNAHTSSFLQVLVSIQSLILVPEPYFNEPGYERSRGTVQGTQSSREYNANIAQATVKWAMLEQIRNPTPCFKHVIHTHFWLKRREILGQVKEWIADLDNQVTDKRTGRAISLNTLALKRHFNFLLEELVKLKVPAGLEDLAEQSALSDAELAEMKVLISCDSPLASTPPAPTPASSFYSLGEDDETEEEQLHS